MVKRLDTRVNDNPQKVLAVSQPLGICLKPTRFATNQSVFSVTSFQRIRITSSDEITPRLCQRGVISLFVSLFYFMTEISKSFCESWIAVVRMLGFVRRHLVAAIEYKSHINACYHSVIDKERINYVIYN